MLQKTGERQIGASLEQIREDHKERYLWACSQLDKEANVLDAGCGVGYGSALLSERAKSVCAVDVSEDAIAYARRYWRRPNVSHSVQDLHFIEFDSHHRFDVVVAFEIIEHMIEPQLFLHSVRKCLAPSARLICSVPNERKVPHTIELNPFHMRHYTAEEITELLDECGYEVNAILSQDERELVPGSVGKFLVVDAWLKVPPGDSLELAHLSRMAVLRGADLIVTRAAALAKARRDFQSIKNRLDSELSRGAEKTDASKDDVINRTLVAIEQRVKAVEASVLDDLRQRCSELAGAERSAKADLVEARRTIARLEGENRSLSAEVTRAGEQSLELSRLKSEVSGLERALGDLRTEAAHARFVAESLADHRTQLAQARSDLAILTVRLESEQRAAQELEVRTAGEMDSLRSQLVDERERLEACSASHDRLLRDHNEQTARLEHLEAALQDAEERSAALSNQHASALAELDSLEREHATVCSKLRNELEVAQQSGEQIRHERDGLTKQVSERGVQVASIQKRLVEVQAELKKAKERKDGSPTSSMASQDERQRVSARLLAIAEENEVLRSANESLVAELDSARHLAAERSSSSSAVRKEPPSVGYVWRKLKHHKFYGPFLTKALLNSLGLRHKRRVHHR